MRRLSSVIFWILPMATLFAYGFVFSPTIFNLITYSWTFAVLIFFAKEKVDISIQFAFISLLMLNVFVTCHYVFIDNIPLNTRYFIYYCWVPAFLLAFACAYNRYQQAFYQMILFFIALNSVVMLAFIIYYFIGFSDAFFSGAFLQFLLGKSYVSYFVMARVRELGLDKVMLWYFQGALLIIALGHYYASSTMNNRKTAMFLAVIAIYLISLLFSGDRAVFIGVALTLSFWGCCLAKSTWQRATCLLLLSLGLVFMCYHFYEKLFVITVTDVRYIFPLLQSDSLWQRPWGVGPGNFIYAVLHQLYTVNLHGIYLDDVNFPGIHGNHLYFSPQSDIVFMLVSFGFLIGLAFYLFFIVMSVYGCINFSNLSREKKTGVILLVFLFTSGFFQSFLASVLTWMLFMIGFVFILRSNPSKAIHDRNQ